MVRPKVGAAEGRGSGEVPRENFVKKTQNPAFWDCAVCSRVEYYTSDNFDAPVLCPVLHLTMREA